jgi:hypothetical protein
MSEHLDRNCVITSVHWKRPDYTRQHLERLSKCDGIKDCLYLPHVEPAMPKDKPADKAAAEEVRALIQNVDFCDCKPTFNARRLGAEPNTIGALTEAYSYSDFCIHLEDDILLSEDALVYYWYCRAKYNDDQSVLSITAYHRVNNAPHPVYFHKMARRVWFHGWGFAMWRSRYDGYLRHQGFKDPYHVGTGWDNWINEQVCLPARCSRSIRFCHGARISAA